MTDPVPELLRQHDELLAKLDEAAAGLGTAEPPLAALVAYLASELEGHFETEERRLFPRLAGRTDVTPDTIALLIAEHEQARRLVSELAEALRRGGAGRAQRAQEVIDFLRAHVAKEDAMLLAVAALLG